MALVMLPCDLPWWESVKKHLKIISNTKNTIQLIDEMQKIHEICNISLDPDEDTVDPDLFVGFLNFLDNDLTSEERSNFLNKTLPNIVKRTLALKDLKPKDGLHFSLQQQPDCTILDYSFISSLIANAFFSTFPKRTNKSHPTLQNFNFTNFFKHLNNNYQKSKLKAIFYYFDWIENNNNDVGSLKILRQVMTGKEWLTIEDWLECNLPLCPLQIKHEGKLERSESDSLHICFASTKIGGNVLSDAKSQESVNLITFPEMLMILLNVEALEDNEVLTIENIRQVSRILDPKNKAILEKLETPLKKTICCMDAENYHTLPISQYEEDNILRELNKCLLAFQQKQYQTPIQTPHLKLRRLSPIGESVSSTKSDKNTLLPLIKKQSASTNKSYSPSPPKENNKLKVLQYENKLNNTLNRRGRFIVLGSSGERLPINRRPLQENNFLTSSSSSDDEFHSAKTSLDDGDEDENYNKFYSNELDTAERRYSFAQRLRDALRREASMSTSSSESSYAVGISISGCDVKDNNIKVKRVGSTGFALREDSLDENFLNDSLQVEQKWIDKFKSKQTSLSRKESNKSSDYSFSTDYSSELEEVYEQFSRWLEDPILETDKGTTKELDSRKLAVVRFAGSLLKRTLSESFAGVPVPLTDNTESNSKRCSEDPIKKNKLILSAKSLSLELARHKHKLAAQLISIEKETKGKNNKDINRKPKIWFISSINEAIIQTLEDISVNFSLPQRHLNQLSQINQDKGNNGLKSVSTGNWGCGTSKSGDVQLKVIIQWLAASVAGIPSLIYYTCGHQELVKLDTVCRILLDRKWSVKDLAEATLNYSNLVLLGRDNGGALFEDLIGMERV